MIEVMVLTFAAVVGQDTVKIGEDVAVPAQKKADDIPRNKWGVPINQGTGNTAVNSNYIYYNYNYGRQNRRGRRAFSRRAYRAYRTYRYRSYGFSGC